MFHQRTREVGSFVVRTGVYSGTVVLKLLRLQPTISRDAVTGLEFECAGVTISGSIVFV